MSTEKEITTNEIWDDSMENAMKLLENSEDLSEEEIQKLMAEKDCMKACLELADCKRAYMKQHASHVPDVASEWAKFQEKTKPNRLKIHRIWGWSATGLVASVLLICVFWWMKNDSDNVIVCFQSSDAPQAVTLQIAGGQLYSLSSNVQDEGVQVTGADYIKGDSARLVYNGAEALPSKAEMHVLSIPRGQEFEVVLADGTKVWLNADSRLEYPSQFTGAERLVRLQGEAYFQVAKDADHPFIVEADGLQTKVLGTEFNVRNYSSQSQSVTLIEGSVEVTSDSQHSVRIKPGENASLSADGTFKVEEVDVDPYVYWKDGFFYFDNVALDKIMEEIGRWYNVNVIIADKALLEYKVRYFCKRSDGLEKALVLLERLGHFDIQYEENTVTIK